MGKWKIEEIDINLLVEAEKNANQMSKKDFEQLVNNINVSGGLSSAIGCYKRSSDGKFVIFSGHHRYRAAVKLRYKTVPVIYAEENDLSKDEIIALQLSHNSLHGEDNKGILKRLFEEIQSVDFKSFAHIDVNQLQSLDVSGISFVPESEHYSMFVVLYRKDLENLAGLLEMTAEDVKTADIVLMADGEENEGFMLKLTKEIRHKYQLRSAHMGFCKLLELAKLGLEYDLAGKKNDFKDVK